MVEGLTNANISLGRIKNQGNWFYNLGFKKNEGIEKRQILGIVTPNSGQVDQSVSVVETTDGRIGILTVDSRFGTGMAKFVAEEDPDRVNALKILLKTKENF